MEQSEIKKIENLNFTNDIEKLKKLEELDKVKSRVLKYIVYKKRTEIEVRNKFKGVFNEELFEETIESLKSLGYIDDENYIDRAVNEYISLNNMSIKEIKYKLLTKGINKNLIEDYFSDNYDQLLEYETKSAEKVFLKKINTMDENEVKLFLRKKGYMEESIKNAEYLYTRNN